MSDKSDKSLEKQQPKKSLKTLILRSSKPLFTLHTIALDDLYAFHLTTSDIHAVMNEFEDLGQTPAMELAKFLVPRLVFKSENLPENKDEVTPLETGEGEAITEEELQEFGTLFVEANAKPISSTAAEEEATKANVPGETGIDSLKRLIVAEVESTKESNRGLVESVKNMVAGLNGMIQPTAFENLTKHAEGFAEIRQSALESLDFAKGLTSHDLPHIGAQIQLKPHEILEIPRMPTVGEQLEGHFESLGDKQDATNDALKKTNSSISSGFRAWSKISSISTRQTIKGMFWGRWAAIAGTIGLIFTAWTYLNAPQPSPQAISSGQANQIIQELKSLNKNLGKLNGETAQPPLAPPKAEAPAAPPEAKAPEASPEAKAHETPPEAKAHETPPGVELGQYTNLENSFYPTPRLRIFLQDKE